MNNGKKLTSPLSAGILLPCHYSFALPCFYMPSCHYTLPYSFILPNFYILLCPATIMPCHYILLTTLPCHYILLTTLPWLNILPCHYLLFYHYIIPCFYTPPCHYILLTALPCHCILPHPTLHAIYY